MGNEVELLEHWRELTPEKQQKFLSLLNYLNLSQKQYPPNLILCHKHR